MLDGAKIRTLEDFWVAIGEAVNGRDGYFASNLDALDDSLGGGMGNPEDGRCTFVIHEAAALRHALGYSETARQLEQRLAACHPTNRDRVTAELNRARRHEGPTAFDWLMESFERSPATLVLN